ncbi:OmpA family protein [Brumimicrobium mesophilum]|uniref:OmpA family protein n=1 Tax=Brumimicrobium mesophilum TaxID=392717 RepID=UPI000D1431F1|nr:OmpA family protein [Brumimicrobium mesophilum]
MIFSIKKVVWFLLVLNLNVAYSQCSPKECKVFEDTIFENNDKILSPVIVYNDGFRILTDQSDNSLNVIANFIKKNENLRFEIGSHTDQRGSEKSNLFLSEKRAKAIKEFLIQEYKIDSIRLLSKGYGESTPIISLERIKMNQIR